eukprot:PhF_6_TR6310/c0_g1_i3/m.9566
MTSFGEIPTICHMVEPPAVQHPTPLGDASTTHPQHPATIVFASLSRMPCDDDGKVITTPVLHHTSSVASSPVGAYSLNGSTTAAPAVGSFPQHRSIDLAEGASTPPSNSNKNPSRVIRMGTEDAAASKVGGEVGHTHIDSRVLVHCIQSTPPVTTIPDEELAAQLGSLSRPANPTPSTTPSCQQPCFSPISSS